MKDQSDASGLGKAGATDTFQVIDDHLRVSIGLATREGWTVLAYLLGMAREQLLDDIATEGTPVEDKARVSGLMETAR